MNIGRKEWQGTTPGHPEGTQKELAPSQHVSWGGFYTLALTPPTRMGCEDTWRSRGAGSCLGWLERRAKLASLKQDMSLWGWMVAGQLTLGGESQMWRRADVWESILLEGQKGKGHQSSHWGSVDYWPRDLLKWSTETPNWWRKFPTSLRIIYRHAFNGYLTFYIGRGHWLFSLLFPIKYLHLVW